MTVCFFGLYARNYSRNHIFLTGLKENSIRVIECNDRSHLIYGLRYLKLLHKFFKLKAWQADVIYVGFPGQTDVPLAWVLAKLFRKKLVFDAFYSLFVSQVYDRKAIKEGSLKAKAYWLTDWLSCVLADTVILDTKAHINYFVRQFRIPGKKFARVLVGTDTDVIRPISVGKHSGFIVGFHGSYLPLQGVPVILRAAKLLAGKDIKFQLVGNGIDYIKCRQLASSLSLTSVEFLDTIPYEKLSAFISGTDLYLGGPFGASLKSGLVIPNKVYEALGTGKATIVGDSQATRELLTDKVNCFFVPQGNPKKLAGAILELKKKPLLREKIALGGYNLIRHKLTPKMIAHELNFRLLQH